MRGHSGTQRGETGPSSHSDATLRPPQLQPPWSPARMVACKRSMMVSSSGGGGNGRSSNSNSSRRRPQSPLPATATALWLCALLAALCLPLHASALWTYDERMPNDNLSDCALDTPEAILSLTFAAAVIPVYLVTSALVWKRRHTFPLIGLYVPLLLANSAVSVICIVARAVLFICWADQGTPCGLEFIVLQSTVLPYIVILLIRGIKLLFKYEITHHLQAVSLKLQEKEEQKKRITGQGQTAEGEEAAAAAAGGKAGTTGSLVRSLASGDRPVPTSSLLRLQAASSPQARVPSHQLGPAFEFVVADRDRGSQVRKPEKAKGRLSFNVDADTPPQSQPPNRLVAPPESSVSHQRPNTIEQFRSRSSGEPLSPGNPASPTTGRPRAGSAVAVSPIAVPSVGPQHGGLLTHFMPGDVEAEGEDSPAASPRRAGATGGGGGGSLNGSPNGSPQFSPNGHRPPTLRNPADSPLDSEGGRAAEPGSPSSLRVPQRYASLDAEAVAVHQDTRITIAAAAVGEANAGDETALLVAPEAATEGEEAASTAVAPAGEDSSSSSDDDLTLLYSGSSGWFVRHRKLVDRKHLIILFLNAHVGAAGIMLALSFYDPDTAMYGGGWTDTEIGNHLFSSPACTFMCLKQWLVRGLMLLAIPLILLMWLRLKSKEADAFGLFHFMASSAVVGVFAVSTYCVFLALHPKWAGPSTVLFQLALFCVSDIKPLIASYTSSKERRRAFAAASAASRTGSLAGGGGGEGAISLRLKQFYRLRQVLRHPRSSAAFHAFTQKEFSSENVIFYSEAKKYIALATGLEQALPDWPRLGEDAHAPIAGIDQSRRKTGDESDAGGSINDGSMLGGEGSTLGGRSVLRVGAGGGGAARATKKHHGPQEREVEAGIIEMTTTAGGAAPASPAMGARNKAQSKYKPSARVAPARPTSAIAEHDADAETDGAAPQQHVTIHLTCPLQTQTSLTVAAVNLVTSFNESSLDDAPNVPSAGAAGQAHARQSSLGTGTTPSEHHRRSSSISPRGHHRPHVASQSLFALPEQHQQTGNDSNDSPVVGAMGGRDRALSDAAPKDVSRSPSLKSRGGATTAAAAPTALSLMRAGPTPADYPPARIAQLREQAVEARRAAITIYKQFIVRGSPFEVNVPHDLQGDIKAQIALMEEWQPVADEKATTTAAVAGATKVLALPSAPPLALSALYRPALVCIFDLMQRDSFRRFVVSPLFAAMLVDLEAELVADQRLKQEAADAAATEAVTRTRLAEENSAILDKLEREAKAAKAGGTPLAGSKTPLALRRTAAPSSPLPGSPVVAAGGGGGGSRLGGGADRELRLYQPPSAGSPNLQSRNGKPANASPVQQQQHPSTPQRSGLRSVHLQPSASPSASGSPGGGWASPSVVALHAVAEDSGLGGGRRSLQRDGDGSGNGSLQGSPVAATGARESPVARPVVVGASS